MLVTNADSLVADLASAVTASNKSIGSQRLPRMRFLNSSLHHSRATSPGSTIIFSSVPRRLDARSVSVGAYGEEYGM